MAPKGQQQNLLNELITAGISQLTTPVAAEKKKRKKKQASKKKRKHSSSESESSSSEHQGDGEHQEMILQALGMPTT
jgi:hypothetical protein